MAAVWLLCLGSFAAFAQAQSPPAAGAPRRVALVIGVSEYQRLPAIRRPAGDATAVHAALEALGVEATLVVDPDHKALDEAVAQFTASLEPDAVALVHFTGHAARLNDDFVLLPANAPAVGASTEELQRTGGVGIFQLADEIRATGARAQVFFVDACRADPYAPGAGSDLAPSSCGEIGRQMPEGSFVLFSASAGQKALDRISDNDPEVNSLFSRVLLRHLAEVRSVVRLARLVRDEVVQVAASVNYQQRPAYLDELVGPPVLLAAREQPYAAPGNVAPQAPTRAPETLPNRPAERQRAFQCGEVSPGPPAFSCRSARRSVEVMICRDPRLGSCDQLLNQVFEQAQARYGRRAARLRQAQDEWLAARDACENAGSLEAATDCVGQAYDTRIVELEQIAVGSPAAAPAAPSFDCRFARSAVEQTICADPDLAAKDREMAELFGEARRRNPRRVELSQRDWRSMRNSCERQANTARDLQACVGEAYDVRITELAEFVRR
jgi:uncharacterized protein